MPFHCVLPALLTVTVASVTPFPVHDLGADPEPGQRIGQAGKFTGGGSSTRSPYCRETPGLLLPFAVGLLSHNHLAAA
jgi:hypothetical protein